METNRNIKCLMQPLRGRRYTGYFSTIMKQLRCTADSGFYRVAVTILQIKKINREHYRVAVTFFAVEIFG